MQKEKNNTSNDIRSMKKIQIHVKMGGLTEYDNQGNPIAFKTARFFKDRKVCDDNGNLMVMYHGSQNELLTEFPIEIYNKYKTDIEKEKFSQYKIFNEQMIY